MRRLLALLVLSLTTCSAFSETPTLESQINPEAVLTYDLFFQTHSEDWALVAENKNFLVFMNTKSIRQEQGGLRSAWFIYSYFTPQGSTLDKQYQSSRQLELVDCEREASSAQSYTSFSDQIAKGDIISIQSYKFALARENMERAAPDTIGQRIVQAVCAVQVKRKR